MHVRTPLLRSAALSKLQQTDVWLKMESSQPSGSFKVRGIGLAAQRAVGNGARRLVSSSGGNAGLAVAHAGRMLGVPVLVVVPRRTPAVMQERMAAQGAQVLVHGEVWDDAHRRAMTETESGGVLIHPFDHPDIWEGHATMIDEVALEMDKPGCVVVSVGGGGLLLGVLKGLEAAEWSDVPVFAVETHGAASLGAAMAAGQPTRLKEIETVALTLGAKQVADEALRLAMIRGVTPIGVSDLAAIDAAERFANDHRVLVEPACGAALSVVYQPDPRLVGPVLVIVCGGASAQLGSFETWRAQAYPG